MRKLKKEMEKPAIRKPLPVFSVPVLAGFVIQSPGWGGGECRMPEHRFYALEAVGVPVSQLCEDMSLLTNKSGWKMRFLKYFGTSRQTPKRWKLTCGIAVKLK